MRALISLLEKVQIQAREKGMSDADVLALRIAPDMFPLSKQVQVVSDNGKGMASRLTGKTAPKMEDTESTIDELKTRLTNTISHLETLTEADFANASTAEARFPWVPGMKIVGADYVLTYGLPNFFFHSVTIYAILRQHGFEIGKMDYMGGEVAFVQDIA
jgi:uncharacterized protein